MLAEIIQTMNSEIQHYHQEINMFNYFETKSLKEI